MFAPPSTINQSFKVLLADLHGILEVFQRNPPSYLPSYDFLSLKLTTLKREYFYNLECCDEKRICSAYQFSLLCLDFTSGLQNIPPLNGTSNETSRRWRRACLLNMPGSLLSTFPYSVATLHQVQGCNVTPTSFWTANVLEDGTFQTWCNGRSAVLLCSSGFARPNGILIWSENKPFQKVCNYNPVSAPLLHKNERVQAFSLRFSSLK